MGLYDGKGIPLKGGKRLKGGTYTGGPYEIDLKKLEQEDAPYLKKGGNKLKPKLKF